MSLNVKGHRHMHPAFQPQPRHPLLPVQRAKGRQYLFVSKEVRFVPQYKPATEACKEPELLGYRIDVQTKGVPYRDVLERALWKTTRVKGVARREARREAARLGASRNA